MPFVPRLASLWRNLLHRGRVEQEFSEELQAYLEMLVGAKIEKGLAPGEARRAALLELGGVEQVKEKVREARMGHFLETVWQDLRYGVRVLVKSPVFTVVAVASLALGIGANTAIFSVVNGLLLRPLPYTDSERLVHVWHTPPQESFPGMATFSASPANYLDWKSQNQSFEHMAAYQGSGFSMSAGGDPVPVIATAVSSDFFPVLRAGASLGRTFHPDEEQPGHNQVVVLSHGLWQRAFGASPDVPGQTLTLDGQKYTVIGVMPAGFQFQPGAEMWVPLAWDDKERQTRSIHDYGVIARLKPGVTLEQAQAEMGTISSRLEQQYPEDNKGWGAVVIPLHEEIVGDIRPALLVLFSAVGFVLLIACANVANLMLARGANRQKEIAIRVALGAPRSRIVRQLLTESFLLAVAGGLLGLLLAGWGREVLLQLSSGSLPNPGGVIGIDKFALGFTLLVSLGAGVVAGIAPALQFAPAETSETLKQGAGRTGSSPVKQRTRKALVISEVALSLILLIGAGLMLRSFWKLQQVDPGFDTGNTLTMSLGLSPAKYPDAHQQAVFFDRVLEQVSAIPGVVSAGATTTLPLSGSGSTQPLTVEGQPAAAVAEQPTAKTRYVSPDYFRAMGIPLRQGRFFDERDREDAGPVVIVSESMARRFWPGQDPLGRRLTPSFHLQQGPREVVGVVGDVKAGLDADSSPTMYLSYRQSPRPYMTVVARTTSDPQSFLPAISRAVYAVDKEQALWDVRTMEQVQASSLSGRRFNMTLLIVFAALALLLAAVGVYGVMNYTVTLRRRELGIRMALGAQAVDVLRLVLRQGLSLTLTGVGVGLLVAYGLTRLMASLLYGVTATDWLTFVSVSGVMLAVGLLASYLPARRATKVDPIIALQCE